MAQDIFTIEIIKDAIVALGDEMFNAMIRTSMSPIIYETTDFAVGATDATGNLLAQGNGVTAFLPSQEELCTLFWGETYDLWEMAQAVSVYGCEYVVIKCGARGQLLYDTNTKKRWEIPAYPARLADPTGAGEAFCGGFLAGYCKNYDPLEGVLYGNISASLKMEGSGAFYPLDVLPGLAAARLGALRDMVRAV